MRGKHFGNARQGESAGSIPAHAGETNARPWNAGSGWVDPRACGGNLPTPARPGRADGGVRPTEGQVDPRACGGNGVGKCRNRSNDGRSPRMRGKPVAAMGPLQWHRSIPAHAGETAIPKAVQPQDQVDPRACGGNPDVLPCTLAGGGRSPRMRGKRTNSLHPGRRVGSIPAHAGETMRGVPCPPAGGVDPRACGGNAARLSAMAVPVGRSPRMRGKQQHDRTREHIRWSIPAHAGETG